MLIEFSVANFLSIKERQTLRMDATGISDYPERVFTAGKHKLLRSAAIYGANASGKSNVLKAIAAMNSILKTSAQNQSTNAILVEPFRLNTQTVHQPSHFEIIFLIDKSQFRYGFEVDEKIVHTEWLFETKNVQEKALFLRQANTIEVSKGYKEGKGLEERTRDNALFLSVCDQFNGLVAKRIFNWFRHVIYTSGVDHDVHRDHLLRLLDAPPIAAILTAIFSKMNFGFDAIGLQKGEMSEDYLSGFSEEQQRHFQVLLNGKQTVAVKTAHKQYDENNQVTGYVALDLTEDESSGTNKFFDLLAPIYLVLNSSGLIIIDELDAKLHPLLTQAIIRLFNDPETNPNNAQLIFATHDTNLLSYGQFRRDQIWFTEKDQYGATCLYSLVEYQKEDGTKVRKDRSFETDYIQGRYGAIPYIGDFSKLFQHGAEREN